MERLWAPWRMTYINGDMCSGKCFICAAAGDPEADAANLVVWRNDLAICIMNRFPYNNGHLLVAPVRHGGEMGELDEAERSALFAGLVDSKALLERVMAPQGFNVGLNLGRTAGAGLVDHLHFHIVPRWDGDTNFMPVLGDTKVMPQALSDLYDKLVSQL